MSLLRLNRQIFSNIFNIFKNSSCRSISKSPALQLKEIQVAQQKDVLTISGEYIESPRHPMLLKEFKDLKADGNGKMFCPKCTLGLDIKHTDVLILSQYIRSDGCMLPRRITGLCKVQQKRIGTLVTMAQKSGLMPNFAPANSKRDPKQRFAWKKYNKYYDESTIKMCNQKID